jgi:hypothetical protein
MGASGNDMSSLAPILVETRTAKPGIEAVPPRGAGPATSQTAIGGGDVRVAIAVAPVGVGGWPAVQQSSSRRGRLDTHRTQHLFEMEVP